MQPSHRFYNAFRKYLKIMQQKIYFITLKLYNFIIKFLFQKWNMLIKLSYLNYLNLNIAIKSFKRIKANRN